MDHPSVTEAENLGVRTASGDIVLFLDDDVTFKPGLIAAHARNYSDPGVSGVAGLVMERGWRRVKRLPKLCRDNRFGYFFFPHSYGERVRVPNAQECNASFRRGVLLDIGLFDVAFRENAYLFGLDLSVRIARAGGKIVHDPSCEIFHLKYAKGGVRMKALRPLSYFRNLFYFLYKHANRHERFAIAARVFILRVLVEGWRRPWVIPANARTFSRAWLAERRARGADIPGKMGRVQAFYCLKNVRVPIFPECLPPGTRGGEARDDGGSRTASATGKP
jgi:GT2 family glycosyltransferase